MNKAELNECPFGRACAVAEALERKVDHIIELLGGLAKGERQPEVMGVKACAVFLSEIEGKKVTSVAVYNRVESGALPFRKKRRFLYFNRSDILEYYKGKGKGKGDAE